MGEGVDFQVASKRHLVHNAFQWIQLDADALDDA